MRKILYIFGFIAMNLVVGFLVAQAVFIILRTVGFVTFFIIVTYVAGGDTAGVILDAYNDNELACYFGIIALTCIVTFLYYFRRARRNSIRALQGSTK